MPKSIRPVQSVVHLDYDTPLASLQELIVYAREVVRKKLEELEAK
jgi:hypothetical protein